MINPELLEELVEEARQEVSQDLLGRLKTLPRKPTNRAFFVGTSGER